MENKRLLGATQAQVGKKIIPNYIFSDTGLPVIKKTKKRKPKEKEPKSIGLGAEHLIPDEKGRDILAIKADTYLPNLNFDLEGHNFYVDNDYLFDRKTNKHTNWLKEKTNLQALLNILGAMKYYSTATKIFREKRKEYGEAFSLSDEKDNLIKNITKEIKEEMKKGYNHLEDEELGLILDHTKVKKSHFQKSKIDGLDFIDLKILKPIKSGSRDERVFSQEERKNLFKKYYYEKSV